MTTPGFARLGPATPATPVIVSVPHAGRDYPSALREALRAPLAAAASLEDRHVDSIALAAHGREIVLIQRRARAWIDLNRAETERDPRVDEGALPLHHASAKLRGGLGLVPRRGARGEDLWRRSWRGAEIDARIAADHRPYHAGLAAALAAARARFGAAVLLDLHSMPPLTGIAPARLVIGDRFGEAAAERFVRRMEEIGARAGLATARNAPYAGELILRRHGAPAHGIHAIQLEIDRSLYLDRALDGPDAAGVARMAALVRAIILALEDEALAPPVLLAAE